MLKTPLKVVLITPGLNPEFGGSAISEASLSSHLQNRCELTVICRAEKKDEKFCRSFGLNEVQSFFPIDCLRALFFSKHWLAQTISNADLVHLNGHWKLENYFIARLCVALKVPYVLHPRGMLVMNQRRPKLKKLFNLLFGNYIFKHAAKVIALSQFECAQFQVHPISAARVIVIPNGITPPDTKLKDIQVEPRFFLYLGRIEERKNLLFLVRAFAKYVKRGGKAKLKLVGPSERGHDLAVESEVQKLKLGDKVVLPGPVYGDAKWQLMKSSIAVLYPTLEEVFGRVPFEALSIGKATIVPDASGSAEYLKKNFSLGIYDHRSEDSLAQCLWRIETTDSNALFAEVSKAQAWIKRELSWNLILQNVLSLYEEILGRTDTRKAL